VDVCLSMHGDSTSVCYEPHFEREHMRMIVRGNTLMYVYVCKYESIISCVCNYVQENMLEMRARVYAFT
jgi:hypothetical protein